MCLWRYPRETVVLAGRPQHRRSEAAARTRSQATGAARGTRQAPLLHPSQFCGGCGFVTPPRASQAPLEQMANSAAVEPLDLEPQNLSFNPRFYLSRLLHFLTCTTEDKLLTLNFSVCCKAEVEKQSIIYLSLLISLDRGELLINVGYYYLEGRQLLRRPPKRGFISRTSSLPQGPFLQPLDRWHQRKCS